MKIRDKIILWLLALSSICLFFYSISSVILPFIVATIIAYFLDPLADKLEKGQMSRSYASSAILAIFLLIFVILGLFIIPLLYSQLLNLIAALPNYFDTIIKDFYPKIFGFLINSGFKVEPDFYNYFSGDNINKVFNISGDIVGNIFKSGIVIINLFSLIFITPILVFYMLRDWDIFVAKIDKYIPSKNGNDIRKIFKEIDQTLSGYVHGQFNVCIILGLFYGIGLTFTGLNFGFLIGFLTGFLSFIPYVGMLMGVAIAIIVGLFQWGVDLVNIGWVAAIFIIGQLIESNFLTPKMVGEKVGLHPVWIIFGLFVFGVLFGFVGILFAMPATAICGVIIKHIASNYQKKYVGK